MQFKRKPWAHQLEALQKASMLHDYGLFFEMGTGKTSTAINILRQKFNNAGRILRTLIFVPSPMVGAQWREEWKNNSNIDLKLVRVLTGPGKKRVKNFMDLAYEQGHSHNAGEPRAAVFMANYESLLIKDLYQEFLEWAPEAVVFDESHRLKSPSTARSQKAYDLANPYDVKLKRRKPKPHTQILSGSPILNNPMDIFQQFKVLDGGETFGLNFFAFRARYFRDRNAQMPKDKYFPKWEIMNLKQDGIDAIAEINAKIFAKAMRVEKKDCLDLPPEVSVPILVDMSPEQARLYKEMKNEFVTFYKSKACTATLAITKALRLMQITTGFVSAIAPGEDDGPVELSLGPTPKLEAFKELLEEIVEGGGKVLVWAVYKHNYKQLREVCEELKIKYVEVHGGVSDAKKKVAVETFQSDADTRVFIGHPGSGGIGLNLTQAAFSIFYSRTFSLEHYLQARARNHRGGSKEAGHDKITHYDLMCRGTIDELAVQKLAGKQSMSARLLSDLANELDTQTIGDING